MPPQDDTYFLVCLAGALTCALPASSIALTTRMLPIEMLAGTPDFVAGSTIVRGFPVPVVVLSRLLGADTAEPQRLVVVRTGQRLVALAVDAVVGFRTLSGASIAALPPLLSGVARASVAQLGALDGAMLAMLDASSLLPESALAAMERSAVPE